MVSRTKGPPANCGYLNETHATVATKISPLRPSYRNALERRSAGSSSRALTSIWGELSLRYAVLDCLRATSPLEAMAKQVTLREPRWPAFIAMFAAAGVYLALPEPLSLGPSWLLFAITLFLMIPIVISDRRGRHNITRMLTFTANGIITFAMIAALIHLVRGIPQHLEAPKSLLRSAVALWVANVLVFALWYWKLDGGGPLLREGPNGMSKTSFLFPQMTGQMVGQDTTTSTWTPHFVDYLFLAFNTSTAFSPTDTAVLSRWAKLGMMLQSLISLAIIALLAARAVNIL